MEFEKIQKIIADKIGMDPGKITLESSFEDMKVDSLDMVEIVMDIEEEFDISIDTESDLKTVADLVSYIENSK